MSVCFCACLNLDNLYIYVYIYKYANLAVAVYHLYLYFLPHSRHDILQQLSSGCYYKAVWVDIHWDLEKMTSYML